jgi:hypothetical protein
MISNLSKSADLLRGNTEWQDLWVEVEKETRVKPRAKPRVLADHLVRGRIQDEQEQRDVLEREAHERQQRNNFYISPQASNLTRRKSRAPISERKQTRERLYKRPERSPPRPKSATNLGFLMSDGRNAIELNAPLRKPRAKPTPVATASLPTERRIRAAAFEGLTQKDFLRTDWTPALPYRPAVQAQPWQNLQGFAATTRALERRRLNPNFDINSFQANKASAAAIAALAHSVELDLT